MAEIRVPNLGESVTDKIKVKISPTGPAPETQTGTATVMRDDVPLRETPAAPRPARP